MTNLKWAVKLSNLMYRSVADNNTGYKQIKYKKHDVVGIITGSFGFAGTYKIIINRISAIFSAFCVHVKPLHKWHLHLENSTDLKTSAEAVHQPQPHQLPSEDFVLSTPCENHPPNISKKRWSPCRVFCLCFFFAPLWSRRWEYSIHGKDVPNQHLRARCKNSLQKKTPKLPAFSKALAVFFQTKTVEEWWGFLVLTALFGVGSGGFYWFQLKRLMGPCFSGSHRTYTSSLWDGK